MGEADFMARMTNGPHELIADEPSDLGGGDQGPAPYDLLLMSLGACSLITMKMYANRKGWPVDDIHMELTHRKEKESREEGGTVVRDVVEKSIRVEGDLSEEQVERLLQISAMCPVHRTLQSPTEIVTSKALDPA